MQSLQVHQTDWMIVKGKLRKAYRYDGLTDRSSVHYLQIDVENPGAGGRIDVTMIMKPNLFPQAPEGPLAGRLTLDEPGEAPADAPHRLRLELLHADDGSLILSPATLDDTRTFLLTLARCKPMRLAFDDPPGRAHELPLLNDEQFAPVAEDYF
jgi:hypothetical protein